MDKSIHTRLYQRVIARLRAKREEKGVTQMQLAEKLGVNQTFVSKVEICERRLDIVELLTICEILEIPFVDFIKEIDEDIISKFKDSKKTVIIMKKQYNIIDLFCGCGGLSKGFEEAGYKTLLGVDIEQAALNTFEKNHKGAVGMNLDLSAYDSFDKIDKVIDGRKVDVIIGGPPCQGFSLTGPRNFEDKRNKLYLAMIETVRRYQPQVFLIENVPGMANLYKGAVKDEIIRRFTDMGYNVNCKIVCAADYGVPQIRKRLVFVGLKQSPVKYDFPSPILEEKDYITCKQAICDLPSLVDDLGTEVAAYSSEPQTDYQKQMRGNCNVLYNHVAVNHKEFVKQVIAQVPDGGNYKDLPEGVGTSRNFHMAWTRYASNKPSRTIDTGHRNNFHYKWNRCPTVRESARLQSFPDDFVFLGNKTQQNKQVGNAVPVLLAYALAKQILKYLK